MLNKALKVLGHLAISQIPGSLTYRMYQSNRSYEQRNRVRVYQESLDQREAFQEDKISKERPARIDIAGICDAYTGFLTIGTLVNNYIAKQYGTDLDPTAIAILVSLPAVVRAGFYFLDTAETKYTQQQREKIIAQLPEGAKTPGGLVLSPVQDIRGALSCPDESQYQAGQLSMVEQAQQSPLEMTVQETDVGSARKVVMDKVSL